MSVIYSVKDSVMHSAVPPVGEILGPELVTGTDSDMSGPNNWTGANLGAFDVNSTVAGKMYMLGDGAQDFALLAGAISIGKTYQMSLRARLNAGASTLIQMGTSLGNPPGTIPFTPTGSEDTYQGVFISNSTSLRIGEFGGFAGIAFEIDDVSVREIL